uniref:ZP domain-containing protein n=1 Tax=Syphacia muris TaxID=451379 RepID=A0A0N5AL83_9BILA
MNDVQTDTFIVARCELELLSDPLEINGRRSDDRVTANFRIVPFGIAVYAAEIRRSCSISYISSTHLHNEL